MEFGASARGTRSGLLWLLAGCLTLTTLPAQAAEERDAGESPASEQVTRETNASANPGNGHGSGSGAVFVDPAGLLLFGPTVGAELGFGHLSAGLYGRWLDGGVVARELFVDQEGESFAFSYGIGLRGRYYLDADLRGLFGGLAIEYLRTRLENESARIVTTNQLLVPQLEGGYRHSFGRFFLGGGAAVGYALQLSGKVDNLPGGTDANLFEPEDTSTIYGTLLVEVGLFF